MTIRAPYGFVGEVAPGADPSSSPATWVFTSDGIRWRQKSGIEISTGRDDESSDVEAGSCAITYDARDGKLSPRNVLGEWYGLIAANTPMRVTLPVVADTFDRTVAAGGIGTEPLSGAAWAVGNGPLWSVSGSAARAAITTANTVATAILGRPFGPEVDIVTTSSISAVPTGANFVHAIMVRRVDATNYYRVHTEYQTNGFIAVKITRNYGGVNTDIFSFLSTSVAFSANTKIATRVRTIGTTIQVRVWLAAGSEPTTWNASVDDDLIDGGIVGLYEWRVAGNTNVGTLTLSVDDVSVHSALWTGQVPEWPVRWPSKSGADVVTPVSGSGILRWLKQGQPPLEAPIPQQLSSYNPQAYWRLDEGSSSTSAGDSVAFGFDARGTDVAFGNTDAPAGAIASAQLNTAAASRLSGTVRTWNLGNGDGSAIMYFKLGAAAPGSQTPLFELRTVGDTSRWAISIGTTGIELNSYDRTGINIVSGMGGGLGIDPTKWFAISVEFEKFGATDTLVSMNWHQVGSVTFYTAGTTQVNNNLITRISDVTVFAPVDNTLVSNVWIGPSSVPFVNASFVQVSSGFAGETDVERIRRVLGYAGIDVFVAPGDGRRLGSQPLNATPLDVVRDAEKGGFGLLYERGAILGYLPWTSRVNVPVTMALDWALGHLDESPEPTDDDLSLVNRWTSSRPNGGSRVAEDEDSIARSRVYADGEEVNVERDEQLDDDAGWHVAVGSIDSLRWPRIKINLSAHPELIPYWLTCRVGSRITLANLPGVIAGEVADLIIEGFEQQVDTDYEWTAEISCTLARPWVEAAVWGEARGDSASCELVEDITIAETAWDVRALVYEDTFYNPTVPGEYSVKAAGEVLPVQSTTTPVLSGGYWTQTITVTRGSALAKTHVIGEPIKIATPMRWGMGY